MRNKIKLYLTAILAFFLLLAFLRNTTPSQAQTIHPIIYDGTGFSPTSLTIQLGDEVQWTNSSSFFIEIASNTHPIHTDYPPLNLGLVDPNGGTVNLVFNDPGTFGYHNHLNETQTGTIIVAEVSSPTPTLSSTPSPTSAATSTPPTSGTPTPCNIPGDGNNDCLIGKADYVYWLYFLVNSAPPSPTPGDFSGDGRVDGIDYVFWLLNLGS